jgi:hypothetical protein
MASLQYSVLFTRFRTYDAALKAADSIIHHQFPKKLWKEAWNNNDATDTTQTYLVYNYKDKKNHFGQIDAIINGSTLVIVFLKYNGYLLHTDPVYLKKFYKCSMAMYMTSFTKY